MNINQGPAAEPVEKGSQPAPGEKKEKDKIYLEIAKSCPGCGKDPQSNKCLKKARKTDGLCRTQAQGKSGKNKR